MKKKILVTGGSGLIGKNIQNSKYNNSNKYELIYLSSKICDLRNYTATKNCFKSFQPDYIIHLAANVGGLFKNIKYPVQMLEDNLLINTNVLRCSYEIGVKRLIACLSTCIFPDNINYPITENDLHMGPPHNSNYAYAYAKRMLEVACKTYNQQYNTNYMCIIPTNIYGTFDNFSLTDGHVIPTLIHKCYLAKQNNQPFEIFGSGKPLRQFLYVNDLIDLIFKILETNITENLILSCTEEISIATLAQIIANCFNYTNNLIYNTNYSDGQFRKTVNNQKLIDLIGHYSFTSLETGLKQTIDWFIQNYPYIRK